MRSLFTVIVLMLATEASHADPALYAGVGVVRAKIDNIFNFDDLFNINDTSWKMIVGWRPTPNWGVEANYVDFGSGRHPLSHGTPHVEADAFAVDAIGFVPLPSTPLDLFAKAGLAAERVNAQSYTLRSFGPSDRLSDHGAQFTWGAGIQAHRGRISTRLEYEHFTVAQSNNGARVISLAATYAVR